MSQCFLMDDDCECLVNVSHIESFRILKEDHYISDDKAVWEIIAFTRTNQYIIGRFNIKSEAKSYLLNWKENMVSTWGYMMEVK